MTSLHTTLQQYSQSSQIKSQEQSFMQSPINQAELNALLSSQAAGHAINVVELLASKGYSAQLNNVSIQGQWGEHTHVDFSGCHFNNVAFNGNIANAQFSGRFEACCFDNAQLNHVQFNYSTLDHSKFFNSQLNDVHFDHTDLQNTWFVNDNITHSHFTHSAIQNSIFAETQVESSTHDDFHVNNLGAVNSPGLSDLFSAQDLATITNHTTTNPTIAVINLGAWAFGAQWAVKDLGANVLKVEPNDMNTQIITALNNDVPNLLEEFKQNNLPSITPAQYMLQADLPSIRALKEYAHDIMSKTDALWIPGDGYDIHPEFYQLAPEYADGWWSHSYLREATEFALIEAALMQNKPIIGVCHGAQLINVYFGGDLHQYVPNQWGDQYLNVVKTQGIIGDAIKDGIWGESMHSQAINHVANNLEVVAKYNDVIKACQAKNGDAILLTQFHPEQNPYGANQQILKHFVDISTKIKAMDNALALADVLNIDKPVAEYLKVKYIDDSYQVVEDHQSNFEHHVTHNPSSTELGSAWDGYSVVCDWF